MNELEQAIALLESDLVWSEDFEAIRFALIGVLDDANRRTNNNAAIHLANVLMETYDGEA